MHSTLLRILVLAGALGIPALAVAADDPGGAYGPPGSTSAETMTVQPFVMSCASHVG